MKVYLASDHGGFNLKEAIKNFLLHEGYRVEDFGDKELNPDDDYTDFVFPLADKISRDWSKEDLNLQSGEIQSLGVVVCRSGSGEVIAANKVKGVRAVLSFSPEHAAKARVDNDANVLSLPSDYIDLEKAKEIIKEFLTTGFSYEERHIRRLRKILDYENHRGY